MTRAAGPPQWTAPLACRVLRTEVTSPEQLRWSIRAVEHRMTEKSEVDHDPRANVADCDLG